MNSVNADDVWSLVNLTTVVQTVGGIGMGRIGSGPAVESDGNVSIHELASKLTFPSAG